MKHAYLIMAHTDVPLLKVLLSMLDDERNDIYLHIDKKAQDIDPRVFSTSRAQLYIADKRLKVYWGHSSQVDLEMHLFRMAHKNGPYLYYHLLSGSDLPIKTQDYIHEFFARHQGKEFVTLWAHSDALARWRMERYHFFMEWEKLPVRWLGIILAKIRHLLTRMLGKRSLAINPKVGANWVSVTHEFLTYLLSKEKKISRMCKYTHNADEVFLQTILWHSEFRERVFLPKDSERESKGCLREVIWGNSSYSPKILDMSEANRLLTSDNLFARKFNSTVDKSIIQLIKERFGYGK